MSVEIVKTEEGLRSLLATKKADIARLIENSVGVDRFTELVVRAAWKNPRILQCAPETVVHSVLSAAQAGLEIDDVLGDGYLVPYWSSKQGVYVCQFIAGYHGLIRLMWNSPRVAGVWCEVVHEKDDFAYVAGSSPRIDHVPSDADDPGRLKAVYAYARTDQGVLVPIVLWRRDIARLMASSKYSGDENSPWQTNTEAMWRKTALRQLKRYLPLDRKASYALDLSDEPDEPAAQAATVVSPPEQSTKAAEPERPAPEPAAPPAEPKAAAASRSKKGSKAKESAPEPAPAPASAPAASTEPAKMQEQAANELWLALPGCHEKATCPWAQHAREGDFSKANAEQVENVRKLLKARRVQAVAKFVGAILARDVKGATDLVVGEVWHLFRVVTPAYVSRERGGTGA